MIESKKDLKNYLKEDLSRMPALGKGEKLFKEFNYYRRKFVILLRNCEYLKSKIDKKGFAPFSKLVYVLKHKRLTKISNTFNLVVPLFSCDSGLLLCHPNIIINGKVGKNATFHGNNCVGEKNGKTPTIGDNVEIGYNAVLIGDITVGNGCVIGACSFINKNCEENTVCYSENKIVSNPKEINK